MSRTLAELTTTEFLALFNDFHAEAPKRSKMTEEEIKDLAVRLNEKIDVPFIKETGEEQILVKIIFKIDTFLYDNLPNEFYDIIRSSDRGISNKEAKRLVRRLTKLANDKIDIPYLPEVAEKIAIKFVIGLVIRAAREKLNFKEVIDHSSEIVVPESEEDMDSMIE